MITLKESKIKATEGYTLYEIPNVDNVMIGMCEGYITLVGLDSRDIWFRLGDREDLIPDELKDFGITSYRGDDEVFVEKFIARVLKVFANPHSKIDLKQKLIDLANETAKASFMNYPDYDDDNPMTTLAEALTLLIDDSLPHDTDILSSELYDLLDKEINEPKCEKGCGRTAKECGGHCWK